MAFTLATHLCGGWCSLSGVMQRTAKRAAKIEPLIALGLHPHCGGSHSRLRAPGFAPVRPRVLARSLWGRLARPSSRALDAIRKSPEAGAESVAYVCASGGDALS